MSVVCGGSESTQLQLVGVGDLFSTDGGSGERMESVSVTGAAQSEKQGKRQVFAIPSGGLHAHRCGAKCDCAAEIQPVPGPAARAADVPPSPFTLSLSLSLRRRRLFASARCGALPAAVVGGCAPHYSHGVSSNEYHPVADTAASSTHAPAYLRESATATKEGERTNGGEREKEGARRKGVSGPAALAARTRRAGLTRKQRARAAAGVGACAPCRATLSAAPTLLAPLSRRGAPRAAARRALTTHR